MRAATLCSSLFVFMVVSVLIPSGVLPGSLGTFAGSVDNKGAFTMLTGRLQGRGDDEALFIWDQVEKKLAIYLVSGKSMKLLFVRNCRYDFEIDRNIGEMSPSPEEIEKIIARQKKKAGEKGEPEASDPPANTPDPAPEPAAGGYSLSLGKIQGGSADALYIWSHEHKRLAVYAIRANVLELLFSRNCQHDFEIGGSLGRTTPEVKDLKELVKRDKKKDEDPPKDKPKDARGDD